MSLPRLASDIAKSDGGAAGSLGRQREVFTQFDCVRTKMQSPQANGGRISGVIGTWAVTSVNFAYGFMLADQGLLLCPRTSQHLFGKQASLGMAAVAVCCGLSNVVGPLAGHWSDRHRSSWGRRRPCMLMALGAIAMSTLLLVICSAWRWKYTFFAVFLVQQIAWNVMAVVQAGLVPDVVHPEKNGMAGGCTAANTLAGALVALTAVRYITNVYVHWAMVVGFGALCLMVVSAVAKERATDGPMEDNPKEDGAGPEAVGDSGGKGAAQAGIFRQVRDCYSFDTAQYPLFTRLLVSKTLYTAQVVVKAFLLYFIQDTFKLNDDGEDQRIVGDTSMAAEAAAALAAVCVLAVLDKAKGEAAPADHGRAVRVCCEADSCAPSMVAADSESEPIPGPGTGALAARRPLLAAIAGAMWMGVMWSGPPMIGFFVLRDLQQLQAPGRDELDVVASRWVPWMVTGTAIWGLGQGVYLAGDQALGFALLPDRNEASRLLGLTSICTAVGAVFGGATVGALLTMLGGGASDKVVTGADIRTQPGYLFPGYAAIFSFAGVVCLATAAVIASIDRKRGRHPGHRLACKAEVEGDAPNGATVTPSPCQARDDWDGMALGVPKLHRRSPSSQGVECVQPHCAADCA